MASLYGGYGTGQDHSSWSVIRVTNRNDSGAGSLRAALETNKSRIIRFDVGGFWNLESALNIPYGNVYIDGSSAPYPGVHLRAASEFPLPEKRWLLGATRDVSLENVEISYLFAHQGDVHSTTLLAPHAFRFECEIDKLYIHHCTAGFTHENVIAFTSKNTSSPYQRDITVSWCVLHHPFLTHPTGFHLTGKPDGTTPSEGTHRVDIHHNLFMADHRNPQVKGRYVDGEGQIQGVRVINNVATWGSRIGGVSSLSSFADWIGNVAIPGPDSGYSIRWRFFNEFGSPGSLYVDGNVVYEKDGTIHAVDYDAFDFSTLQAPKKGDFGPVPESYRRQTPLPDADNPILIQSAADAYTSVLAGAGAGSQFQWDYEDAIKSDVANGTQLTGFREDNLAAIATLQEWTDENSWYPLASASRAVDPDGEAFAEAVAGGSLTESLAGGTLVNKQAGGTLTESAAGGSLTENNA